MVFGRIKNFIRGWILWFWGLFIVLVASVEPVQEQPQIPLGRKKSFQEVVDEKKRAVDIKKLRSSLKDIVKDGEFEGVDDTTEKEIVIYLDEETLSLDDEDISPQIELIDDSDEKDVKECVKGLLTVGKLQKNAEVESTDKKSILINVESPLQNDEGINQIIKKVDDDNKETRKVEKDDIAENDEIQDSDDDDEGEWIGTGRGSGLNRYPAIQDLLGKTDDEPLIVERNAPVYAARREGPLVLPQMFQMKVSMEDGRLYKTLKEEPLEKCEEKDESEELWAKLVAKYAAEDGNLNENDTQVHDVFDQDKELKDNYVDLPKPLPESKIIPPASKDKESDSPDVGKKIQGNLKSDDVSSSDAQIDTDNTANEAKEIEDEIADITEGEEDSHKIFLMHESERGYIVPEIKLTLPEEYVVPEVCFNMPEESEDSCSKDARKHEDICYNENKISDIPIVSEQKETHVIEEDVDRNAQDSLESSESEAIYKLNEQRPSHVGDIDRTSLKSKDSYQSDNDSDCYNATNSKIKMLMDGYDANKFRGSFEASVSKDESIDMRDFEIVEDSSSASDVKNEGLERIKECSEGTTSSDKDSDVNKPERIIFDAEIEDLTEISETTHSSVSENKIKSLGIIDIPICLPTDIFTKTYDEFTDECFHDDVDDSTKLINKEELTDQKDKLAHSSEKMSLDNFELISEKPSIVPLEDSNYTSYGDKEEKLNEKIDSLGEVVCIEQEDSSLSTDTSLSKSLRSEEIPEEIHVTSSEVSDLSVSDRDNFMLDVKNVESVEDSIKSNENILPNSITSMVTQDKIETSTSESSASYTLDKNATKEISSPVVLAEKILDESEISTSYSESELSISLEKEKYQNSNVDNNVEGGQCNNFRDVEHVKEENETTKQLSSESDSSSEMDEEGDLFENIVLQKVSPLRVCHEDLQEKDALAQSIEKLNDLSNKFSENSQVVESISNAEVICDINIFDDRDLSKLSNIDDVLVSKIHDSLDESTSEIIPKNVLVSEGAAERVIDLNETLPSDLEISFEPIRENYEVGELDTEKHHIEVDEVPKNCSENNMDSNQMGMEVNEIKLNIFPAEQIDDNLNSDLNLYKKIETNDVISIKEDIVDCRGLNVNINEDSGIIGSLSSEQNDPHKLVNSRFPGMNEVSTDEGLTSCFSPDESVSRREMDNLLDNVNEFSAIIITNSITDFKHEDTYDRVSNISETEVDESSDLIRQYEKGNFDDISFEENILMPAKEKDPDSFMEETLNKLQDEGGKIVSAELDLCMPGISSEAHLYSDDHSIVNDMNMSDEDRLMNLIKTEKGNINDHDHGDDLPEILDDVKDLLVPIARRRKAKKRLSAFEDILKVDADSNSKLVDVSRKIDDPELYLFENKVAAESTEVVAAVNQSSFKGDESEKSGNNSLLTEEEERELAEINLEQEAIRDVQRRELEKFLEMPDTLSAQEHEELEEILAEESMNESSTAESEARLAALLAELRSRYGEEDPEEEVDIDHYLNLPSSLTAEEEMMLSNNDEKPYEEFESEEEYRKYIKEKYLQQLEEDKMQVEEDEYELGGYYEDEDEFDYEYEGDEDDDDDNIIEGEYVIMAKDRKDANCEEMKGAECSKDSSGAEEIKKKPKKFFSLASLRSRGSKDSKSSLEHQSSKDSSKDGSLDERDPKDLGKKKFFRYGGLSIKRKKKKDDSDQIDCVDQVEEMNDLDNLNHSVSSEKEVQIFLTELNQKHLSDENCSFLNDENKLDLGDRREVFNRVCNPEENSLSGVNIPECLIQENETNVIKAHCEDIIEVNDAKLISVNDGDDIPLNMQKSEPDVEKLANENLNCKVSGEADVIDFWSNWEVVDSPASDISTCNQSDTLSSPPGNERLVENSEDKPEDPLDCHNVNEIKIMDILKNITNCTKGEIGENGSISKEKEKTIHRSRLKDKIGNSEGDSLKNDSLPQLTKIVRHNSTSERIPSSAAVDLKEAGCRMADVEDGTPVMSNGVSKGAKLNGEMENGGEDDGADDAWPDEESKPKLDEFERMEQEVMKEMEENKKNEEEKKKKKRRDGKDSDKKGKKKKKRGDSEKENKHPLSDSGEDADEDVFISHNSEMHESSLDGSRLSRLSSHGYIDSGPEASQCSTPSVMRHDEDELSAVDQLSGISVRTMTASYLSSTSDNNVQHGSPVRSCSPILRPRTPISRLVDSYSSPVTSQKTNTSSISPNQVYPLDFTPGVTHRNLKSMYESNASQCLSPSSGCSPVPKEEVPNSFSAMVG